MARKLRQLGAKPRRGLTLTSVSSRPRTCAAALLQRYRPGALNSPALGSRPAQKILATRKRLRYTHPKSSAFGKREPTDSPGRASAQ